MPPAVFLRLTGHAPVGAEIYECERLRCNLCVAIFTAAPPEGVRKQREYDVTVPSFIAVLKDVEAYNELFDSADHVELIEETDTFHMHYLQTKVPWPISDRDGVYSNTYSQHYGTKAVTVDIASVDGVRPEEDGYVRIKDTEGYWLFYPVSNDAVEVTYEVHADPGGNIPSWVINMFLVDTPLSDIKNLQEQARLPKYANQKFDFLVDN
jgi:hypothetical protein